MSAAFKCDRCGDFSEVSLIQSKGILVARDIGSFCNNAEQELCQSCKSDFRSWWGRVARPAKETA